LNNGKGKKKPEALKNLSSSFWVEEGKESYGLFKLKMFVNDLTLQRTCHGVVKSKGGNTTTTFDSLSPSACYFNIIIVFNPFPDIDSFLTEN
jgi:hypothetical protein